MKPTANARSFLCYDGDLTCVAIELCEVGLGNRRPIEDLSCVMMGIFYAWQISFLCDDGRIGQCKIFLCYDRDLTCVVNVRSSCVMIGILHVWRLSCVRSVWETDGQ